MARTRGTFGMREIDRGLEKLREELIELGREKPYAKAGLIGPKASAEHEGGLTNVDLGIIHEFGAPKAGIPARPWVSAGFKQNERKYQAELREGLKKVYEQKMTAERLLGLLGAQMASDIKSYVTAGAHVQPENKPATIEAKGSDRPLVDTGRMVGAVTWPVVKGEK